MNEYKKTLLEQLELLKKRSQSGCDVDELCRLTDRIIELVVLLNSMNDED